MLVGECGFSLEWGGFPGVDRSHGARLPLYLLLGLGRLRLLVADAGPDRHQGTAAVDGVEEVPRLLRDLPRVGS